jgi:2-dehydropantoate 2-reductase
MSLALPGPVAVMGAGSVGCYVGGCLQAAGAQVHFIGRPRVLQALRTHGLALTDLHGGHTALPAEQLHLHDTPQALSSLQSPALVLLCVKSGGTAEAAAALAGQVRPGTPVLSLQNGVANVQAAEPLAPSLRWLPGMVAFNVAELGPGQYHRGTFGDLAVQDDAALAPWLPLFKAAGLPLQRHRDLTAVQWGKLLLNLENPVNALSGLPLRAELLDRNCRVVFAALQEEALAALAAAGIVPARLTPLPPSRVPQLLRMPTPLFRVLAARMLKIDNKARSSMADDLALGRPTEVDALCGAVVRLAHHHGLDALRNARMVELLSVPRPQAMGGAALRRLLGL